MNASASAHPANRIRIVDTGELPPAPPEEIENASQAMPAAFALGQNYPNPFNPETRIAFALPQGGDGSLKVYNMLGEEVAVLLSGYLEPGYRTVTFDASRLPSGVYAYRLTAGAMRESRKMLLLK
jgi:hypothetical protein